ncbi:MAG: hypothetical protein Fur0010_28640 [Bdellovibrio sp.]
MLIIIVMTLINLRAETFELAGKKIELPIEKSWLSKAPRRNALVFFDPKIEKPRPIITVSTSPFKYPKNASEFEETYKSKKLEWIQEVQAKQLSSPQFNYNPDKKGVVIRYSFEVNNISFDEISSFQECESIGYQIKIMQSKAKPFAKVDELMASWVCPKN